MKRTIIAWVILCLFLMIGCVPTNSTNGCDSTGSTDTGSTDTTGTTNTTNTVDSAIANMPNNWPLTGNLSVHDPGIIKDNKAYYVYGTGIGIEVKRSYDGTSWSTIGKVFNSYPSWANRSVPGHESNIWAPDVEYFKGKYHLYYSVSSFGSNNSAIGLATTSSLPYGWQDQGMVIRSTSANNYNCIDPNLVIDASGNPWLAFGSFWSGIKIVQLDPSTMKPKAGASPQGIASRNGGAIEAADIIYKDGKYYLFASIDKCCNGAASTYKIIFGRSAGITGPYLDKSGKSLMSGGGTIFDAGNDRWRGPGGQSILGTGAIAHHAYDASNNGAATLMIKKLHWDASGWPYKGD